MALIKCKECDKEISSEAPTCPGCGAPIKPQPQPKQRSVFATTLKVILSIIIIGFFAIVLFFYTCYGLYKLGDSRVEKYSQGQNQNEAETEAAKSQIYTFQSALTRYKLDHGQYPMTREGLDALLPYLEMKSIPEDPWGNAYLYTGPADPENKRAQFYIVSFGPDGEAYTSDDISSNENP